MEIENSAQVSAPGRLILFGEHAINFGHPAIALAVDYRMRCRAQLSSRFTVNGEPMEAGKHRHARAAVIHGWTDMDKPLELTFSSDIPAGLGLGEDPASAVACLGALSMLHDHIIFEQVARNSFDAACEAQGDCPPLDTSVSTHGSAVIASSRAGNRPLWKLQKSGMTWHVNEIPIRKMDFILGYSGTPSPESEMLSKVKRFREKNSFARDILNDIGEICLDGETALLKGDAEKIGNLMGRNHRLLMNLGIGTPVLEKMARAASVHSYGVKITGSGGGGCIVALAREPERVVKAIEGAGGKAFFLPLASEGVRPED